MQPCSAISDCVAFAGGASPKRGTSNESFPKGFRHQGGTEAFQTY